MGMLMHHTWLEQQKKAEEKPKVKPIEEMKEEISDEPDSTLVKKTAGRRKVSK